MNIRAHIPVDKAAFFDFIRTQAEGRFEYDRGLIVQQMTGGTGRHTLVSGRFADIVRRQLNADAWLVSGHVRGVETLRTIRYPDVLVEAAPIDLDSLATSSPMLIVEVLSPSTRNLDLTIKPAEYTSLASLQAYVAAEPDQAVFYLWRREAGGPFPADPTEIRGADQTLILSALGLTVAMRDVYRDII